MLLSLHKSSSAVSVAFFQFHTDSLVFLSFSIPLCSHFLILALELGLLSNKLLALFQKLFRAL